MASSCTSTLVGSNGALGGAGALTAAATADESETLGVLRGVALSAGPLVECAPSQAPAAQQSAKMPALCRKSQLFRLVRPRATMPKYAYHASRSKGDVVND